MALSDAQRRALALLPKPSGVISGLCSALIMYSILRNPRKRNHVYHRLLLGISTVDVLNSFWFALSTWPIPHDSAGPMYAVGNAATCELQGFWIQFGNAAGLYNAALAAYYLLLLRYGWKEAHVQRWEAWFHGIPIAWGAATATMGIPLRLYNNANLWCWIASYPTGCVGEECIRAPDANMYRWMFYYGPLWMCIVFVTIAMAMVYQSVGQQISLSSTGSASTAGSRAGGGSRSADDDSSSDALEEILVDENAAHDTKQTRLTKKQLRRNIALQCFLYAASFYFNWIWLTTVRILQAANHDAPFELVAVAAAVTPLFGLPNFCVYTFPTFWAAKQAQPNAGIWAWICASLQ